MQNSRLGRPSWLKALRAQGSAGLAGLYAAFFGALAVSSALLNVYLQGLGFSGLQIASFSSISPAIRLVGQPLWGIVADMWGRRRILLLTMLVAAAALLAYTWPGSYLYFLLLSVVNTSFACPISPLIDSVALDFVDAHPGLSYGKLRVWGSAGFTAMALVTGLVVSGRDIRLAFVLAAGAMLTAWLLVFRWAPGTGRSAALKRDWRGAGRLLRNRGLVLFLGLAVVQQVATSAANMFYPIYLGQLGAKPSLISSVVGLRTLSELPVLFFAGRLVARVQPRRVLVLAMLAYAGQFLGYSLSSTPLPAILVEMTHGLSFGFMLVGAVEYINRRVPPAWRATGQTLYAATSGGAGSILGNLWAGFLYDAAGARMLFRINGFMILAVALVALLVLRGSAAERSAAVEEG